MDLRNINTIPEERTLFEAHQKYVDTMNTILSDKEEVENNLSETRNKLDIANAALSAEKEKSQKLKDLLIAHGIDPGND